MHVCTLTTNSFCVIERQEMGNNPLLFHSLSLLMGMQSWTIHEPACFQTQEEAEETILHSKAGTGTVYIANLYHPLETNCALR